MKLTMVFEAQTDDEADQIATLQPLLQEHPIGRITTVRATGTIEAIEGDSEAQGSTPSDADYYRYARLVKRLLTTPTRMGGLIAVQDVILMLAEEFKIGDET